MKIALLHISDLHIKSAADLILTRAEKVCATLTPILPDLEAIFLVVTGDIAYGGTKEEYELAKKFFQNLLDCIALKKDGLLTYFISVPGNHDGTFKSETQARKALIKSIQAGEKFDDSTIGICVEPQNNYFDFEQHFDVKYRTFSSPLWKQHIVEIGGKRILFSALNASWMSQVPELPGKLVFPAKDYEEQSRVQADVKIALMHHPLNWYTQASYHPLRELCRTQYQIIMSGHEHTSSASIITDLERGESVIFEAGVMSKNGTDPESHFSVITLDLNAERFAKKDFDWQENKYIPSNGEAVWDSFVAVPKKRSDGLMLTDGIKSRLAEIGATFTHPNKEKLFLNDIYVFPDLEDLHSDSDPPETVSAQVLVSEITKKQKVILRGDDQSGKTALLHSLYQKYFDSGFTPLLMSGRDFGNHTEEQFQRRILVAVSEQYGEHQTNTYSQLERGAKVLLLDDLDRHGVKGKTIAKILSFVDKHFEHAIISVSENFDIAELSSPETVGASANFYHYRFLGFGFKLRSELIRKWLLIGTDQSEQEIESKAHEAQEIIDSVIGKGLVPTTAFNILVLLQSMEAGTKGVLSNAGMAQYYEFLIRRSFVQARLRPDQFDEVINYLAHLAWHFHTRKASSEDEIDLREFNAKYSNEIHNTDFAERFDFLVRCRALNKTGTAYSFRYPYIRYFFAAQYIAKNLDDNPELRENVIHACNHLYLKENGNIILFLAHHSSARWIIDEVTSVLSQLLQQTAPLDLEKDTSVINAWISQTARVLVDTSDVAKNRRAIRERDDENARIPDRELSTEVNSLSELDFIAQINLLFKTSEILGQIIKNRYGSLEKSFKKKLMLELFKGPLKGINFFLSILNAHPEALIEETSKKFVQKIPNLNKSDADKLAQRLIFSSIGMFGQNILARQADIIGSPKLKETIDLLLTEAEYAENQTFKLVSISAQLSYPGAVPVAAIELLADKMKNNVFGYKLLQGAVARHMYMFSVPYAVRQQLGKAVQITEKSQDVLSMRSAETKKVTHQRHRPTDSKGLLNRLSKSFLLQNKEVLERRLGLTSKTDSRDKED